MLSNTQGQILIQGLGVFIGLLLLFLGLVAWGFRAIEQMHLDTAAQATALSSARAQAQMLNDSASHNLMVNIFVPIRFKGLGATQKAMVPLFKAWLRLEDWKHKAQFIESGFLGYPVGVGQVVARLNGSDHGYDHFPKPMDLQLVLEDLLVTILKGDIPVGEHLFEDVYFVRTWKPNVRKAQPTHKTTWLVSRGKLTSTASAGVYLDIKEGERLQNGGFPRLDETWEGDIEIQSFYPQFNARLIKTLGEAYALVAKHRAGI
jgi:hypothetical protein